LKPKIIHPSMSSPTSPFSDEDIPDCRIETRYIIEFQRRRYTYIFHFTSLCFSSKRWIHRFQGRSLASKRRLHLSITTARDPWF